MATQFYEKKKIEQSLNKNLQKRKENEKSETVCTSPQNIYYAIFTPRMKRLKRSHITNLIERN